MKILIVDDPQSANPVIAQEMSAHGHDVHRVEGGDCAGALRKLQDGGFDLVMLAFSPGAAGQVDVIDRMLRAHRDGACGALRLAPEVALGALVSLDEVERAHAGRVMARTSSLEEAARILGIDVATLYRKRKRWAMPLPASPGNPKAQNPKF